MKCTRPANDMIWYLYYVMWSDMVLSDHKWHTFMRNTLWVMTSYRSYIIGINCVYHCTRSQKYLAHFSCLIPVYERCVFDNLIYVYWVYLSFEGAQTNYEDTFWINEVFMWCDVMLMCCDTLWVCCPVNVMWCDVDVLWCGVGVVLC